MPKHVTHKQADDALCDPGVPLEDALRLFKQAYRRSNAMTKVFVLHWTGVVRAKRTEEGCPVDN